SRMKPEGRQSATKPDVTRRAGEDYQVGGEGFTRQTPYLNVYEVCLARRRILPILEPSSIRAFDDGLSPPARRADASPARALPRSCRRHEICAPAWGKFRGRWTPENARSCRRP